MRPAITPQDDGEGLAAITREINKKWARSPDELVELFSGEVWKFASSQLPRREDAEDVVMEVFAAAFSNFTKLGHVQDQRLWLLSVARKRVAGSLRQKYRRAEQPLSDSLAAGDNAENSDLIDAVQKGIKSIPQPQAEVLVLKYVNDLSTEEVSRVIGKSLAATNSLLQRARESFKESVGPGFEEYARNIR